MALNPKPSNQTGFSNLDKATLTWLGLPVWQLKDDPNQATLFAEASEPDKASESSKADKNEVDKGKVDRNEAYHDKASQIATPRKEPAETTAAEVATELLKGQPPGANPFEVAVLATQAPLITPEAPRDQQELTSQAKPPKRHSEPDPQPKAPQSAPNSTSSKPSKKERYQGCIEILCYPGLLWLVQWPVDDRQDEDLKALKTRLLGNLGLGEPELKQLFSWPVHPRMQGLEEAREAFWHMQWAKDSQSFPLVVGLGAGAQPLWEGKEGAFEVLWSHSLEAMLETPALRKELWEALGKVREQLAKAKE